MEASSNGIQGNHREPPVISVADYDRDYFLRKSHSGFDVRGPVRKGPASKVDWFKHLISNRTILDVGCGRGEQVRVMAELGASLVVGLEWSSDGVAIARDFCTGIKTVIIIQGDARKFRSGIRFNVVTMFDFIEHLTEGDARLVYKRCADEWLTRHGWLCIICPPKSKHKYHLYHQSRETLRQDIEGAGFDIKYLSAHKSATRSSRIFVVMAQKREDE